MNVKNAKEYTGLAVGDRLRLAEQIYVAYPRSLDILAKIEHCHQYSIISAEPECMLIKGDTGTGKTTLYRRYEQNYPRIVTRECTIVTVLSATIPVPATPKNLVTKLLLKLGDPLGESGTLLNQTLRLCWLLKKCQVRVIILDEFQHFIDRDSNKILQTISDWLKELLNETRVPIILIGMPKCDRILDDNPQLRRRFAIRETLEPFGWKHNDSKTQKNMRDDLRRFLKLIDEQLPLKERSHLADITTAYRIHEATHGNIASIVKLLRRAVVLALTIGAESISLEMLATAYDERLRDVQPKLRNPFLS
jgi:hypothetical protein